MTEWLDHPKIRQCVDQRLVSIWFGEANRIKARPLTVAVEMSRTSAINAEERSEKRIRRKGDLFTCQLRWFR